MTPRVRLAPLRDALDRLLRDAVWRERYLLDGPAALGLGADDARAFAAVDTAQLRRSARKIADGIVERRHRGSPGLLVAFAATLSALGAAPGEDVRRRLIEPFVASSAYRGYAEVPVGGRYGTCVEEAFFLFLCDAGIGDPVTRRHEFLIALMQVLALQPRPAFSLPAGVVRVARGHWTVEDGASAPALYAAIDGRVLRGSITPLLAAVLRGESAQHSGDSDVATVRQRLRALGLVDDGGSGPRAS